MSKVNWDEVQVDPSSRSRDDSMTRTIIEGALLRPTLSASSIAKACGAKESTASTTVNHARATVRVLVNLGEIHFEGKTYALNVVPPRPELVKKPA